MNAYAREFQRVYDGFMINRSTSGLTLTRIPANLHRWLLVPCHSEHLTQAELIMEGYLTLKNVSDIREVKIESLLLSAGWSRIIEKSYKLTRYRNAHCGRTCSILHEDEGRRYMIDTVGDPVADLTVVRWIAQVSCARMDYLSIGNLANRVSGLGYVSALDRVYRIVKEYELDFHWNWLFINQRDLSTLNWSLRKGWMPPQDYILWLLKDFASHPAAPPTLTYLQNLYDLRAQVMDPEEIPVESNSDSADLDDPDPGPEEDDPEAFYEYDRDFALNEIP